MENRRRKNNELKVLPDTARNHIVCMFEITLLYNTRVDPGGVRREVLALLQISLLHCMQEKVSVLMGTPRIPFKFSVMNALVVFAIVAGKIRACRK